MLLTVISFILVMGVLVFVHELGHFLIAKRNKIVVEEFGFGYPPRVLKLFERNGTIYSINAIPFGGFCRMRGEDDPSLPGNFASASKGARIATLLAGAGMNFVLSTLLFAGLALMNGVPDASRPGVLVKAIAAGSPAQVAGLQIGDRIISANGTPLTSTGDLQDHTKSHTDQAVRYQVVRPAAAGGAEQTLSFTITPRANPPQGEGALGIQIGIEFRRAWLWEGLWSGVKATGEVIMLTFAVPATLIREGRPISDAGFMGPVGIAATTGDVVRSALTVSSVQPVIYFMGLLSAAIGITNLLPIPALDGGRLLFIALEIIRRKRVEPEQEGLVHLVGFGLLLALVGVVTVREVSALLSGTFPSLGLR